MWQYIITFVAVFATDMLYIYFVKAVQNDKPWTAGFWSMAVTFTASVAVINYTEDHMMLIPALLGAFSGAYIGVKLKRNNGV